MNRRGPWQKRLTVESLDDTPSHDKIAPNKIEFNYLSVPSSSIITHGT